MANCAIYICFRVCYLAPKWAKYPPKLPQPSIQPKGQQRTSSASRNPERFEQQADRHQPPCLCESPEVKQEPFETTTSYMTDYVVHPVQPRVRAYKPVSQSREDLLSEPTQNQEKHQSTTHADFIAHKCQRVKPILPTTQNYEKSTEPFHSTTTMKEDFKAWNASRRQPIIPKQELDWLKKYTTPKHESAKCPRHSQTNSNLHPEPRETVVPNATRSPQSPAVSEVITGFESFSNGFERSSTFWNTTVSRRAALATDEVFEEPQQMMSSMVSSRADHSPKTRPKKKRGDVGGVSAFNTNKSKK